MAIQNARLYGDVEHLAITDGLTGLYNHRYFYDRLAQDVARAKRYDLPLSLLMIDIDDFKSFNDAHGHRAGDGLLRELGHVLRAQTRQQIDLVARYGGEEFAVILPSTGVAGATRAGERLLDAVAGGGLDATPAFSSAATPPEAARAAATRATRPTVAMAAAAPPTWWANASAAASRERPSARASVRR